MAVTWVMYSPDFAQWKCEVFARQHDDAAGRIGLYLITIESIAQADVKDARHDRVDSILRMSMRHQLHTVGHFDSDYVWTGF